MTEKPLTLTDTEIRWLLAICEDMHGKRAFTEGSTGRKILMKLRQENRQLEAA